MNFDMDSRNHCVLILAGLPTLINTLKYNTYEAIRQRIAIQYQIIGIDPQEIKPYVETKLKAAGLNVPLFTDDAMTALGSNCQGSIRKLNNLLTQCLIIGATKQLRDINNEIVMMASNGVDLN